MINPLFAYHRLSSDGVQKTEAVAYSFSRLLMSLESLCPTGTREFSLVKTKLEEACFFAKKAIANDPANQAAASPCSHCGDTGVIETRKNDILCTYCPRGNDAMFNVVGHAQPVPGRVLLANRREPIARRS